VGTTIGSGGTAYPAQVTALSKPVVSVAIVAYTICAVTNDGSVWCAGDNTQGLLGNGLSSGTSNVPVQVMTTQGGSAFAGADQVVGTEGFFCALKSADGSIWCWGSQDNNNLVPFPWTENSLAITGVHLLASSGNSILFVDGGGVLHAPNGTGEQTAPVTTPVQCP
jgi:alpha-tubulin suppressor-like RCC1 family protein